MTTHLDDRHDDRLDAGPGAVLLTGYDVKRCQRRVHNDHDATLARAPWEPPADLAQRFEAGRQRESLVFTALREALPRTRWRDLSSGTGRSDTVAATVSAMAEGVEVILGGWLPDDAAGGRTGRPDLLLRVEGGYVPGDVKGHQVVKASPRRSLTYSRIQDPGLRLSARGLTARVADRRDDYLQLAHYWRMLQACGYAARDAARGFIIGTDVIDTGGIETDGPLDAPVLTWLDLEASLFTTYSRSRGRAKRTALEHYDFEHAIRREIADTAARRCGADADPAPLVEPIFSSECATCPWLDTCSTVSTGVASAEITAGRLDVREWRALARAGVVTTEHLATLRLDAQFLADYLPEVSHHADAEGRLATAVRRARMVRAGVTLERTTSGPVPVPRADVEVDFDLEDADGRVYLWGAFVRDGDGPATYVPTVDWAPRDDTTERDLARTFVGLLRRLRHEAESDGRTLLAYHYTAHEVRHLERILGADEVADVREVFVDLHDTVRSHYFGVAGLGLKHVAPAFGFAWRDDEPSGMMSQLWYAEGTGTGTGTGAAEPDVRAAARRRLLDYNEDDVRATAVVRDGIGATT